MLLLVPEVRETIKTLGVEDLFQTTELQSLARQLIELLDGVIAGEEAAHLSELPEPLRSQLQPLLQIDRELFADTYEQQLQDYRRAAERETLKQRYKELPGLIGAADGDLEIELMREFTQLKKRLN